jgi:hypothetical protein
VTVQSLEFWRGKDIPEACCVIGGVHGGAAQRNAMQGPCLFH